MKTIRMGAFASIPVVLCSLALFSTPAAHAQDSPAMQQGPPKYLYLSNAELKPGHDAEYAKLESEENDALRAAKVPAYHFGLWAITGNTSRVLTFGGYESYAEMEKIHGEMMSNATAASVLEKNNAAEGLISTVEHGSIYKYQKDLSLTPPEDLGEMRFMRIILFKVHGGQEEAFEHLVKVYKAAYAASLPQAHWAMFQKQYGEGSGTTYMLATPIKSLDEVDGMVAGGKTFMEKTGPDLLAMLEAQGPSIIESEEADIFVFDPRISYVPDEWLTKYPDYWGKK